MTVIPGIRGGGVPSGRMASGTIQSLRPARRQEQAALSRPHLPEAQMTIQAAVGPDGNGLSSVS